MLIDSHAHLNFEGFRDELIFPGISKVINIGTTLADSEQAVELAQKHAKIFATVGIHPHEANSDWEKFEALARQPKVVAIGECGLDLSSSKDLDSQEELLRKQVEIAKKLNLPLILHIRDAQEELISKFGHALSDMTGVFHCFSGSENYLRTILNLFPRFYVSFAGNITFKNAGDLRDLVRLTPLERMLIETDSPFLTPEPHRGSRNSPENVKIVAERIGEIKDVSTEQISEVTTSNATKLFGL